MAAPSAAWQQWANGVLAGIGAPVNQTNYDSLQRWTAKEGTRAQNNPLATSQPASGATNFNSAGVKNYPTADIGAQATAQTLMSGLYPNILLMLRNSTPASQWSPAARYDLDTWAHGPHGAHYTTYSDFLGGQSIAGGRSLPGSAVQGQGDIPGSNSAVGTGSNATDPITALGKAIGGDVQKILFFAGGGLLMLLGLIILALVLVRGAAAPAAQLASTATPIGRGLSVIQGGKKAASSAAQTAPTEKPLSPGAQSAIAAAKAGRGSKLSPEVKAELRAREKAS